MSANSLIVTVCGLLVLLVVVPMVHWLFSRERPTTAEWKSLSGVIGDLSRDDIASLGKSGATKSALGFVLTERIGHANKHNLPFALQVLEDAGMHVAAGIRSLSTVAVFLGLGATALIFADVLGELASVVSNAVTATGSNQLVQASNLEPIFRYLRHVYVINSIAIGMALVVYVVSRMVENDVHDMARTAMIVMSQLPDNVEVDADPRFLAAIRSMTDVVQEQLHSNITQWQEAQLEDIREIVREVNGLAGSIKEAVDTLKQASTGESAKILAAVHATQNSVMESAVRLEDDLGMMINEAAPALERFSVSAEELSKTTDRLRTSGTLESVTAVKSGLEEMRAAVAGLPGAIDDAFRAAMVELRESSHARFDTVGNSIVASIDGAIGRLDSDLKQSLASLPAAVAAATAESLAQQAAGQARAVEALSGAATALNSSTQALTMCAQSLVEAQKKLQVMVDRGGGRWWMGRP